MKSKYLLSLTLVCFYLSAQAHPKVPMTVVLAFNHRFPKAAKVRWHQENAHEFEASFESQGEKRAANFSDKGKWLESETEITFEKLPNSVRHSFQRNHKGAIVKAAAIIESFTGITTYEVEVKQGLKTLEFFYTREGAAVVK